MGLYQASNEPSHHITGRPDIALFAYTYVSYERGFPLPDLPKIRDWIENRGGATWVHPNELRLRYEPFSAVLLYYDSKLPTTFAQ